MLQISPKTTVPVFAALGVASGIASAIVGIDRPLDGLQPVANLFGMQAGLLPVGLCFAAAMACAAWLLQRTIFATLCVLFATLYGWSGAVHIAIRLQRSVGDDLHLLAASLAAGAFGAGMVYAGFALAAPHLRTWRGLGFVSAAGAAAGLVFLAGERGLVDRRVLFLVWQPIVAASIALLLSRKSQA